MSSSGDSLEQEDLARPGFVLELYQRERERIRSLEPDGWRRERILDRAVDKLLRRIASGCPPSNPRPWFREVVANLIKSNEIPWSRELPTEDLDIAVVAASDEARTASEWRELFEPRMAWLLLHLPLLVTDAKQRSAFLSMLQYGTKAGARSMNMDHRSFRRTVDRAITQICFRIEVIVKGKMPGLAPPPPLLGVAAPGAVVG